MGFSSPAAPGGSSGQVQFNDTGAFAGSVGLRFDPSNRSFVAGYAEYGTFTASTLGSIVMGYADTGSTISATNRGSIAMGHVQNTATITATKRGAVAMGYATGSGNIITSSGYGSFAMGNANQSDITASGDGSFAGGTYGDILASGKGSFAFGYPNSSYTMIASGYGSVCLGYAGGANISASATNAMQFGQGGNSQADSLSIGTTVRLKGTTGAPGTPRDGDIWVNSNYTYIRSNGSSVKIV